jgi:FkbM family methyltransferase
VNLAPSAQLRALLWHPRQRLWNRALVSAIEATLGSRRAAAPLIWLVMLADTVLLLGRVARRRLRLLGVRSLLPRPRRTRSPVLYVDCGVHEHGDEIRLVHRWLAGRCDLRIVAFEAASRQFAVASEALADVPALDLRRQALVGPDHTGATVTLHRSPGGYADSIFADGGADREEVPATRLSAVLLADHARHDGPVIVRMNIEGAELAVIEDLVVAGLDGRIDGWYGLWDDVGRIDPTLHARFSRLLVERDISPLTFNGRDVGYALRRLAIRIDLATSIGHGDLRGPRRIADAPPHRAQLNRDGSASRAAGGPGRARSCAPGSSPSFRRPRARGCGSGRRTSR